MDNILHSTEFKHNKATSEELWRSHRPDDSLSSLLTLRLAPTNNEEPISLGLNSHTQNCMWLLREVSSDDTKLSSLTSLSKDAEINKLIQSPSIREIAIAQKRPRLSLCDNSSPGSPATECNTPTSTAPRSKSLRYLSGDDVEDGEEAEGSYKRKLRLDKDQFALLEDIFAKHQRLTPKHKAALAKQLNVRTRQVEVWFQNRRARTKVKQTELEREKLKSHCDALIEENRRLQLLVQDLRAHQAATASTHKSDIWDSQRANLSMSLCPSCQKITPIGNLFPQKNQDGLTNSFVNHQQHDIKPLNLL